MTALHRLSTRSGTFKPGRYIIVPQENGVEVFQKPPTTFAAGLEEVPRLKKAKVSDTATEGSSVSTRGDLLKWTLRGYQSLIADPYTATRTENATRNKRDPLRINSLEILCLTHHRAYDIFRFSIHPKTHKIFAFHPAVTHLHDLEVTSPWQEPNPMYPGPHHKLLRAHFQTSIFASLSATAEPLDDDEGEEEDELPEISSDHNEVDGIWASDSNRYLPVELKLDNEERDNSNLLIDTD